MLFARILISTGLILTTSFGQMNSLRRRKTRGLMNSIAKDVPDFFEENSKHSVERDLDPDEDHLFFTRMLETSMSFSLMSAAPPRVNTFDINDCESYSFEWLMDLAATCENYPSSTVGCKCTTSALTCNSSCPDKCSVCDTCLSLLNCVN